MSELSEIEKAINKIAIPINALFDGNGPNLSADPRGTLRKAQLIFGVDVMTRNRFLVYGRPDLERIVSTGQKMEMVMAAVELDEETDELEKLLALVQVVKGRHDYEQEDE